MVFWLAAAALTIAACLAVLAPLARKPVVGGPADGNDLRVYKDQLAEVDRDVARGALASDDADQARAEIGRRIMRIHGKEKTASAGYRSGVFRIVAAAAVLAVPVISWGVYAAIGSPELPSQPLAARLAKPPSENSPEELIARAESHLAQNPDDGRGWDVLAPTYTRLGRFPDAIAAYQNAIRIQGDSAERSAGLGEALALANGGIVSADAETAFRRAIELEPGMDKARFFLAFATFQEGKTDEAVAAWTAMRNEPDLSPQWRSAVDYGLAQAEARKQTASGAPAPSQEQIDSAAQMSAEDRAEMIETMVASLDERLRANPDDPEGWERLVRSYQVLGRPDAAKDALKRALGALGAESDGGKRLAAFAAEQGMSVTE